MEDTNDLRNTGDISHGGSAATERIAGALHVSPKAAVVQKMLTYDDPLAAAHTLCRIHDWMVTEAKFDGQARAYGLNRMADEPSWTGYAEARIAERQRWDAHFKRRRLERLVTGKACPWHWITENGKVVIDAPMDDDLQAIEQLEATLAQIQSKTTDREDSPRREVTMSPAMIHRINKPKPSTDWDI